MSSWLRRINSTSESRSSTSASRYSRPSTVLTRMFSSLASSRSASRVNICEERSTVFLEAVSGSAGRRCSISSKTSDCSVFRKERRSSSALSVNSNSNMAGKHQRAEPEADTTSSSVSLLGSVTVPSRLQQHDTTRFRSPLPVAGLRARFIRRGSGGGGMQEENQFNTPPQNLLFG